jgi:hypothetical protein
MRVCINRKAPRLFCWTTRTFLSSESENFGSPPDSLRLFIRHCRDDVLKVSREPVSSLIYPPQSLAVTLKTEGCAKLLRYPSKKQPPWSRVPSWRGKTRKSYGNRKAEPRINLGHDRTGTLDRGLKTQHGCVCCKAVPNRKWFSLVSFLYKETKNYATSPRAWTVTFFQLLISLPRSNRTWREHEGVVKRG